MISIDKTYRSVPKGPTDNHFKPDEARAITHTQTGIILCLIAAHQARSVRIPRPLVLTQADLVSIKASQAAVSRVLPLAEPRPGSRILLYKTIVVSTRR